MREKIYANYNIKRPYYFYKVFFIVSVLTFILVLICTFICKMQTIGFLLPAFFSFAGYLQQRELYLSNKNKPIIYFNEDEIIVNYHRTSLIIKQEEIESFEIKKKRILKISLKRKKSISISLYHLTYQKIDYVDEMLRLFINKNY